MRRLLLPPDSASKSTWMPTSTGWPNRLLAATQQQEMLGLLFQERQLFLMEQGVSGL